MLEKKAFQLCAFPSLLPRPPYVLCERCCWRERERERPGREGPVGAFSPILEGHLDTYRIRLAAHKFPCMHMPILRDGLSFAYVFLNQITLSLNRHKKQRLQFKFQKSVVSYFYNILLRSLVQVQVKSWFSSRLFVYYVYFYFIPFFQIIKSRPVQQDLARQPQICQAWYLSNTALSFHLLKLSTNEAQPHWTN